MMSSRTPGPSTLSRHSRSAGVLAMSKSRSSLATVEAGPVEDGQARLRLDLAWRPGGVNGGHQVASAWLASYNPANTIGDHVETCNPGKACHQDRLHLATSTKMVHGAAAARLIGAAIGWGDGFMRDWLFPMGPGRG